MEEDQSGWPEALHKTATTDGHADVLDQGLGELLRGKASIFERSISASHVARGRKRLMKAISPIDRTLWSSAVGGFFGAAAASIAAIAVVVGVLPTHRTPPIPMEPVIAIPKGIPDRFQEHGYADSVLVFESSSPESLLMSLVEELTAFEVRFSIVVGKSDVVVELTSLSSEAESSFRRWLNQNRNALSREDSPRLLSAPVTLIIVAREHNE